MNTLNRIVIIGGTVAVVAMAMAAVTFNEQNGEGFVGKGDVQVLYGMNDKALQDNWEDVSFAANKTVTVEREWDCVRVTNNGEEVITERNNSAVVSSRDVVKAIGRDKKGKITGFILQGYGATSTIHSGNQGPATGSCPGNATLEGEVRSSDPVVTDSNLFVSYKGEKFQLAY
jgi:hypothetical protein